MENEVKVNSEMGPLCELEYMSIGANVLDLYLNMVSWNEQM